MILFIAEDTSLSLFLHELVGPGQSFGGIEHVINGQVLVSGAVLEFVPTPDYAGWAAFSYRVQDESGNVLPSQSWTFEVTQVNDAPVANADTATVMQGGELRLDAWALLQNDTDVDHDVLSVDGVWQGLHGTVMQQGSQIVFTPEAGYAGLATFSYTARDGQGGTATAQVNVEVVAGAEDPVVGDDFFYANEDQPFSVDASLLLANDFDPNLDALTIVGVADATHGTVYLGSGGWSIGFMPDTDYSGSVGFSYTVSDSRGNTTTGRVTLDVMASDDPPRPQVDFLAAVEDTPTVFLAADLFANDWNDDAWARLAYINFVQGGTAVLSEDHQSIRFTPAADFHGQAEISYMLADGAMFGTAVGTSAYVQVAPRNDAPRATADLLHADENQPATFSLQALLANDRDPEGDAFTVTALASGAGGTVQLLEDDTFTFTPDADFSGTASFSYTLRDRHGASSTGHATVDVVATNQPPIAVADFFHASEDQPLWIDGGQLVENDSDPEGGSLTVIGVADATHGTVSLGESGQVSFTPDADYAGAASFTYSVADARGGTATATVTLDVMGHDDPIRPQADFLAAVVDTPTVFLVADLLANDWNDDAFARIVSVDFAEGGTAELSQDRQSILFTPATGFAGQASFGYTLTDNAPGVPIGVTAIVQVGPVNQAPTTRPVTLPAVAEDSIVTITAAQLLANASDVDSANLAVTGLAAQRGTLVDLGNGSWVYTPLNDDADRVDFTYAIDDGATATAGVAFLDLLPVNDAPRLSTHFFAMDEDQPASWSFVDLLANGRDPEGSSLEFVSVQDATQGRVTLAGTQVTFVADPDYFGPAGFTYTVRDAEGATTTADVHLLVLGAYDAPRPGTDSVTLQEDVPLVLAAADLLANDRHDGDALSIVFLQAGNGGTPRLADDAGSITFTPEANFTGLAGFSYLVSDGKETRWGSVLLTVAAVNDAPVAGSDIVHTIVRTPVDLLPAILANDTDADGDSLALVDFSLPGGFDDFGSMAWSPKGLVFTPKGVSGEFTLSYVVGDPHGGRAQGQVTLRVAAGVNSAGGGGSDTLVGSAGDDTMTGAGGNDVLQGLAGNDFLDGGTGRDSLVGGLGNDTYKVDHSGDVVSGEAKGGGIDKVIAGVSWSLAGDYVEELELTGSAALRATGNSLDNALTGNAGANVLDGDIGADTLRGAAGSDTYYVDDAGDSIVSESSSASGGIDKVFASVSWSLAGDYVEHVELTGKASLRATGNGLDNALTGNAGHNLLDGGSGDDTLSAGAGNDTLAGGSGDDFLTGGAGKDQLTGGAGADRFLFIAAAESTASALDVIADFKRGTDRISLANLDANAAVAGVQDFRFIGSAAFGKNATGQLRTEYSGGKLTLYGSTDADGTAEFAVQVLGVSSLGASDFLL